MPKYNPNDNCGLCNRVLGTERIQFHHLIPKTFGGKELAAIHAICHRKIHSLFTERELLKKYNTFELLLRHNDIQNFVVWIKNKPSDYYDGSDNSKRKR